MLTDRPIPGQSLTTAPKSFSYERPPDVTNPLDALELHFDKLNDPRGMEDIGYILESNIDLVTLTEGQLRSAVANGIHSIDISLLIAPIIHEYIKGIALAVDSVTPCATVYSIRGLLSVKLIAIFYPC